MLHPVTGTPLFAHVDLLEPGRRDREELRCFYAAQYEMVNEVGWRWGMGYFTYGYLFIEN